MGRFRAPVEDMLTDSENTQPAIENGSGLSHGGVGRPHNLEGLGSSNSVFIKKARRVFGVWMSSDGAKVKRLMMSACVCSGRFARYGSTIASCFSVGMPSNCVAVHRCCVFPTKDVA